MAESFGWLHGQVLKDRWNMNDAEITDLIFNYGLPVYEDETMLPVNIEEEKEYMMSPDPWGTKEIVLTLKDRIDICLFRLREVERFEREHPELMRRVTTNDNKKSESLGLRDVATDKKEKKSRPNQRDKSKAQEFAQKVWKNDPMPIAQLAREIVFMHDRDKNFFEKKEGYRSKTIYNWIKSFALNHSPGRRPKS